MENILFLVSPAFITCVLLLVWKRHHTRLSVLPFGAIMVLIIQVVVHLVIIGRLWWLIDNKLGFQSLPPKNQYLLTEAIGGLQPIIVGAIHAVLWFLLLWYVFLRRGKGAMLDTYDVQLLVLCLLAVGWPAGLIFLAATFLLAVVGMIGLVIVRKKTLTDRLIITPYIIPAAILTLFFGSWAMRLTHLDKIRF